MYRKIITILICLIFFGTSVVSSINIQKKETEKGNQGNTLYVGGSGGGNYTKIQDAIDNAIDGDTVFVYDDNSPYFENLNIYKSILLEGENQNTTIIDGSNSGHVIKIIASGVTVKKFSIQNSGEEIHNSLSDSGIFLQSNDNKIFNNHIKYNRDGISTYWEEPLSKNNIIRHNLIYSNDENGIELMETRHNNISDNEIFSNIAYSIYINSDAVDNIIYRNVISENNDAGICLWNSGHNQISSNILHNNSFYLANCNNNMINNNKIFNSFINMEYDGYNNILINNTINGKPIICIYNEKNKIVDLPEGQIIIVQCDNITVKNQEGRIDLIGSSYCNITNNKCCIVLRVSANRGSCYNNITNNIIINSSSGIFNYGYMNHYNIITRNLFQNNNIAIKIICSRKTTIKDNIFKENTIGIDIHENELNGGSKPYDNLILRNNFISNEKDIKFQVNSFNIFKNFCLYNYWGEELKFIKVIRGKFIYGYGIRGQFITIRWWFVDWHPAKEPYDIEVFGMFPIA